MADSIFESEGQPRKYALIPLKATHPCLGNGQSLSQSKRPDISEDGIYTKKMSVDASRVDSHSNHIINNTKLITNRLIGERTSLLNPSTKVQLFLILANIF